MYIPYNIYCIIYSKIHSHISSNVYAITLEVIFMNEISRIKALGHLNRV